MLRCGHTQLAMTSLSTPREYVVSVATNDIREAVAQLGSALYDLLEQALMTADDEDESYFDQFARETLNVLARHPEQLSGSDSPWEEELEHDADPSEMAD
jgi:hypothetical protein